MLLIVAYVLTKILFLLDLCNQVKGKLKMHTIHINNRSIRDVIIELEATLGGNLKEACGEYTLTFDNEYGKGIIRGIIPSTCRCVSPRCCPSWACTEPRRLPRKRPFFDDEHSLLCVLLTW